MDPSLIGGFAVLLVGGIIWAGFQQAADRKRRERDETERRARVRGKYAGTPFAEDILAGVIRQGMTAPMVIDAWGDPAAVDRKVYKTKIKEVWKYGPGPRRTFANRVTIEDGIVVGWESR